MSDSLINDVAMWLKCPIERLTVIAKREGRLVLRVTNPTGDLLVKASVLPGAFDEEVVALRTLAAEGLPVSPVLAIEHGPPALLMTSWTEGIPISTTTDRAILQEVGVALRRIHSVPAAAPFSGHPSVEAWIESWFLGVTQWWRESGFGSAEEVEKAIDWLHEVHPLLAAEPGGRMLFDGRPDHFLVRPHGTIHMIDVADLQSGDSAMDLAVLELEAPGILQPVLAGHDPNPAEAARFDRLIPFYVLLRALSAAEWQSRVLANHEESHRYLGVAQEVIRARDQ